MEVTYNGINDAYADLVTKFHKGTLEAPTVISPSRDGEVTTIEEPVLVCYRNPLDRVLLDPVRDCNPFFHIFEAMWMLAGMSDVKSVSFFNSQMKNYSDDGETFNGAYGERWRLGSSQRGSIWGWVDGVDQIEQVISYLRKEPQGRRAVIQMWNVWDDLLRVDSHEDIDPVREYSKDVCCNTAIYLRVNRRGEYSELDITVTNRSNDAIWGMLGANYVQMSFLQEYLAFCIGCKVGRYYQFTNNLHVYNNKPGVKLEDLANSQFLGQKIPYPDTTESDRVTLLGEQPVEDYDEHVRIFDLAIKTIVSFFKFTDNTEKVALPYLVEDLQEVVPSGKLEKLPFITGVLMPMVLGFCYHKRREYVRSYDWLGQIKDPYWRSASIAWISKREQNWKRKNHDAQTSQKGAE